ncbi:MAG: DUF4345 family protein [Deltaproteobacteria bacterium]|nr:MAG: DUF4345 family protein [Deltaproteobacteria bacterium]
MAQNNGTKTLKVVLVIFAIVSLVYGLCYLLIPDVLVAMSGGNPVDLGWLRWPGGVLITLGIGALLVRRDPAKQGVFVLTISLGTLLTGLGLLYSWIVHEYSGATWFIVLPAVIVLILSALLWWSRQKAKGIL